MKKNAVFYCLSIIFIIFNSCSKENENVSKSNSILGFWKQTTPNFILEFGKDSILTVYKLSYNDICYLYDKKIFTIVSENNIVIDGKNMLYKIENGQLNVYDENKSNYYAYPLTHCDKPELNPIPNKLVNLSISLNYDYDLNATLACKIITKPRFITDVLGFGGVLIINGFGTNPVNLYAFNATCPVECDENIQVIPDEMGKVKCPKCGSVYVIYDGSGKPENGSKYPLYPYKITYKSNNGYIISNFTSNP